MSEEFQCHNLTGTERKSSGTDRTSSGTERKSPTTGHKSPGTERRSHVTGLRSSVTNDFESNYSPSWPGSASLEEFSPEIARQDVESQTTDGSRSDAEESSLISVRSEDLTSRTPEIDLDLLTWRAEIEQLFQGSSMTYEQDWEEEIDSLGVLRDRGVRSGSADEATGAGTDPLLDTCLPSHPPLENVSGFVVDQAQSIVVEVAEEERGTCLLSQQPKRYLRVFNDEDSLSIISERTEPTGSDQDSVDLDLPASETGWHSDAFDACSDEEGLGITLTEAGIDRAIDRIVDLEAQRCPSPGDLDAEMDRLVATNRDRALDMATLTKRQVDELKASCIRGDQHPVFLFYSEPENDYGDANNTSANYESLSNTYFNRSSNSLSSGSSMQMPESGKEPDTYLISRDDDLGDATTSDPVSLTVVNSKHLISCPPVIQPFLENSVYSSYNVRGRESGIPDPIENGIGSSEDVSDSAGKRTRSKTLISNGELTSGTIHCANVNKLNYASSIDEKINELENEESSGDDVHSRNDWKNLDGNDNQKDAENVSLNETKPINCSGKQ